MNPPTENQLASNRRNAQKSTGPRSAAGKAVSSRNAVKHGIVSQQVVVRGRHCRENIRQFQALHRRFREQLQPVGPVEEMLVDHIVTAQWRLRRALVAESGEIALNAERDHAERNKKPDRDMLMLLWRSSSDPLADMSTSALGLDLLLLLLGDLEKKVEATGLLEPADIARCFLVSKGPPNRLTIGLTRLQEQKCPEGTDPATWAETHRDQILDFISLELFHFRALRQELEIRKNAENRGGQAAAMVPALPILDRILRYETKLERQIHRAMIQLERLQRMRLGDSVPAPVCVEMNPPS